MGRIAFPVLKDILVKITKKLDTPGHFTNQTQLFIAIANEYNTIADIPKKINKAIVRLRLLEYKIQLKTRPGKKGRPKNGQTNNSSVSPNPSSSIPTTQLTALRNVCNVQCGNKYNRLVAKIERGHLRSAVKMQHLQCMGYDHNEIQKCDNKECSLWSFR